MVDDNIGSVYRLLHLIRNIPGSNICYKDTKSTILWSNEHADKDLKQSIVKKTSFDLFSPESAQECLEYDQKVISSNNAICKQQSVKLKTGESREYFVTKMPWIPNKSGPIKGLIVNAINMKETVCKQLKNCYSSNYQHQNNQLIAESRNLHFYLKQPLQEVLLLVNLIMSEKINNDDTVSLCSELKKFVIDLLSYCNFHLHYKSNSNIEQIPLIFNKINLRELVKEIFNKEIRVIQVHNIQLFLTVSAQIPQTIFSDILRINKILRSIIVRLLESALNFKNVEIIKFCCNIELFHKVNNNSIIISLLFELENYLLDTMISDEHNFEIYSFNSLVKELNGHVELNKNKKNSILVVHLPVEVLDM